MPKVIVLGGGIAGLTAAHELIARGFDVEVYEQHDVFGGKARSETKSIKLETGGTLNLPTEHGFRFFPGFYRHLTDTMKRIPYKRNPNGVFDNLVSATGLQLAQERRPPVEVPTRVPQSLSECANLGRTLLDWKKVGIPVPEAVYFAAKMFRYMVSSDERRFSEYEATPWWRFVGARYHSRRYQRFLSEGLTRSLIAMKARRASTRTVAKILSQMVYDFASGRGTADRVLNGPTNKVWIDPWVDHLIDMASNNGTALRLETNARVAGFAPSGGRIDGAIVEFFKQPGRSTKQEGPHLIKGDYYVAAIPVECMERLVEQSSGLRVYAPSVGNLSELPLEWMSGIQFFLKRDVPIVRGHTVYLDSPWALTSISQRQFWNKAESFSRFGEGKIGGILSVDISDWNAPGNQKHHKPASRCTEREIKEEVWEQIKAHLEWSHDDALRDDDLVAYFLDDAVAPKDEAAAAKAKYERLPHRTRAGDAAQRIKKAFGELRKEDVRDSKVETQDEFFRRYQKQESLNFEPLLINTESSWQHRPSVSTEIPNLFLASDYVRTSTDLATMEGANEAARRAVNAIIRREGSFLQPCRLWALGDPWFLQPLRKLDALLYRFASSSAQPKSWNERRESSPQGISEDWEIEPFESRLRDEDMLMWNENDLNIEQASPAIRNSKRGKQYVRVVRQSKNVNIKKARQSNG